MARNFTACIMAVAFLSSNVAAVGGGKAVYVAGTIGGLSEKTEGTLDTQSELRLIFLPDQKGASPLIIHYEAITDLEYGQRPGRRLAVAELADPLALSPKERRHFLTVSYKDEAGRDQAAVLEIAEDIIRTMLTIVEARSGIEIQYQNEEARKAAKGL